MISRRAEATGSGIMYFVFFLMVAVIVGGIYGGLIAFFGDGYNYRESEAFSLSEKVRYCVEKEALDLNSLTKEDFADKCKISLEVIEDGDHLIYLKKGEREFFVGTLDFKVRCGLNSRFENSNFPLCNEINVSDTYVLTGSSQNSRRVVA